MNTFLVLSPLPPPDDDPFVNLQVNIEIALRESRRDFKGFACFLGKPSVKSTDVLMFVSQLKRFLSSASNFDSDVAIIRYESKVFYVCCPHLEDQEGTASYFINGFNCLPEYVLEGTGFGY